MEQRPLRRVGLLALSMAAAAVGGVLLLARPAPSRPSSVAAPAGVRVRVEVLNATATSGLARRATAYLRDRGFDVVEIGTAQASRDSTLVLDRSGHPDWAQLVARALGNARVESRPDSSRYLDVTVLVGRDWTTPAESFYP